MEAKIEKAELQFHPVNVTIRCDTHEDLLALMDIFYAASTTTAPKHPLAGQFGTTLYSDLKKYIIADRNK